jgi:hypothetical protein
VSVPLLINMLSATQDESATTGCCLTSSNLRRTIVTMRSLYRGVLAVVVSVTLCGATWATCVEGADASETQQMACCKAGHDHCPMKDRASTCCLQSGARFLVQAAIVNVSPTQAPVRIALARVVAPPIASAHQIHSRASSNSSPPDSRVRPPAYLLFSTLLI